MEVSVTLSDGSEKCLMKNRKGTAKKSPVPVNKGK